MGGEQSRLWQQLYFFLAVVAMVALGPGCTSLQPPEPEAVAKQHLEEAERRIAKKDYEKALSESQAALSQASDPGLRQRALFQMAVVYSQQDSQYRDFKKAASLFTTLSKSNPQSPFAIYAEMWLSLRENNITLADENRKLKQILEKIKEVDIEIERKRRQ